jgi:uncharacterized membrane protein YkvA (DUF1232 family)
MVMTFNQLRTVLLESHLSPEELAPKLGVASMTIRRWKDEPGKKNLPKAYERSVLEGIYQLLIEGHLNSESDAVQTAISSAPSLSFQAVLKTLGVADDVLKSDSNQEDKMTLALYQIGASEKRKKEVDQAKSKLQVLKKMGQEWTKRISMLMDIIQSKKFTVVDKLVAYGALFYLICPFDLIPDQIPVIGYVDDFAILGFAIAYYLRKFPEFFSEQV